MNAAPPKIYSPPNQLGWFAAIIFSAAIFGGLAFIFFFDPSRYHFYPVCQFHKLTGLNCPGCGATRSLFALLHGDFLLALRDNALFIASLIFLAARGIWFAAQKYFQKLTRQFIPAKILWLFLFVAIIFTMLRNLPAFAFLSP